MHVGVSQYKLKNMNERTVSLRHLPILPSEISFGARNFLSIKKMYFVNLQFFWHQMPTPGNSVKCTSTNRICFPIYVRDGKCDCVSVFVCSCATLKPKWKRYLSPKQIFNINYRRKLKKKLKTKFVGFVFLFRRVFAVVSSSSFFTWREMFLLLFSVKR